MNIIIEIPVVKTYEEYSYSLNIENKICMKMKAQRNTNEVAFISTLVLL